MVLSLYLWGTSSAGTGVQRTPPRWTGNPSCTGIQSRNRSCWRWEGTVCSAWSGREREDKWARVIREDVWYEMFFTNYNGLIAMLLCVILSFPDISVWIKTHLFRKKRYFAPKWVEQRPTYPGSNKQCYCMLNLQGLRALCICSRYRIRPGNITNDSNG